MRGLLGAVTPSAAKSCLYKLWHNLQADFNGSMFDESVTGEAAKLNDSHIGIIASFLNGEELKTGQLTFDLWIYNFEVIPVETISAIYEDFLAFEDVEGQRDSGAYYTPKHLAELVADIAIDGSGAASHSPKPTNPPALTRTSIASWLPSPMSSTCGMDR